MPLFKQMQQEVDRLNLLMKKNLTGVRAIRAFNRQDYETEKFGQANQEGMQAVKANYAVAFCTVDAVDDESDDGDYSVVRGRRSATANRQWAV